MLLLKLNYDTFQIKATLRQKRSLLTLFKRPTNICYVTAMYLREIHKEIIESRGMAIVLQCKDDKRMVIHKNRSIATTKQKM